jgi:hypothetical protein
MRAGFGAKTIFTILRKWDIEDDIIESFGNGSAETDA